MSPYTVTVEVTVFVEAESAEYASWTALEAILDADTQVCGNAEVAWHKAKVQPGVHYTINH